MKKLNRFIITFSIGLSLLSQQISFASTDSKNNSEKTSSVSEHAAPEILIPGGLPVYLVVKGIFPTREKAEQTQAFIQQLLVKTPADGIIASGKLKGFPPGKWVVTSAFDNEKKAKWWLTFGDRNPTLPRPTIRKTEFAEDNLDIPYFPDAVREGFQRFYTEEEVLKKIQQLSDVQQLQQTEKLKFLFTRYPRTGDYTYEVEIMKEQAGAEPLAYDFVTINATDLNDYSRFTSNLKLKKTAQK